MKTSQFDSQTGFCGCHSSRRAFLADWGMGFTGLAMGSMLFRDGVSRASAADSTGGYKPPDGRPMHAPKTKSIIWIFLSGGYSHIETFDPKPALNKYSGITFDKTGLENPLKNPLHDKRSRSVVASEINVRDKYPIIYPLQVGFKQYGQSGIAVSDWWPHLAGCVDDIAFVRNMWTTDNDHAAENQIHTGRHRLDEVQPSIGGWVTYGLGSLNDNLPQFVVLGGPTRSDTRQSIEANYLGPQYGGVPIDLNPSLPLPYGKPAAGISAAEQRREFELARELNGLVGAEYPEDDNLRARIRSYELAYRMQSAVPETVDLARESAETQSLYGLDQENTKMAGQRLLAARRLVERGVRFVQVFPSAYGVWDSHQKLKENHTRLCATVDKPVAGLLKDLKRRGLWDDVTVVFCTEFGRTPGLEQRSGGKDGRDHHPHGFTIWMAGAGIKGGMVHGETDELGFHALEPAHYVTDLHATVLHLMGLDGRKLEVPGRKRLEIDHGKVIHEILA
jgi:Protein of unknown function (DUF1501)